MSNTPPHIAEDAPLILNVDDFEPGRYARSRLLKQAGYRVIEAGTGRQAMETVKQQSPLLAILDINLPDISGIDLCRQIKTEADSGSTLVLQISATAITTNDWASSLESGADAYLIEPVDPAVLIATVRALIRMGKIERALVNANRELRRSNADLELFAFAASHDLQEPLRTVSAFAQLLTRRVGTSNDPEVQTYIDYITHGTERMQQLINGILVYAQAGAALRLRHVDLNEVLRVVSSNLEVSLSNSGGEIETTQLPCVRADFDQISRVFQNLLSNAIRYRSERPLHITATANREGRFWKIGIHDNGVGFNPNYRQQIFEIFKSLDRKSGGSGIGLAIVRRIVENHGGRVWAESTEGTGSAFYFTIPATD